MIPLKVNRKRKESDIQCRGPEKVSEIVQCGTTRIHCLQSSTSQPLIQSSAQVGYRCWAATSPDGPRAFEYKRSPADSSVGGSVFKY